MEFDGIQPHWVQIHVTGNNWLVENCQDMARHLGILYIHIHKRLHPLM